MWHLNRASGESHFAVEFLAHASLICFAFTIYHSQISRGSSDCLFLNALGEKRGDRLLPASSHCWFEFLFPLSKCLNSNSACKTWLRLMAFQNQTQYSQVWWCRNTHINSAWIHSLSGAAMTNRFHTLFFPSYVSFLCLGKVFCLCRPCSMLISSPPFTMSHRALHLNFFAV